MSKKYKTLLFYSFMGDEKISEEQDDFDKDVAELLSNGYELVGPAQISISGEDIMILQTLIKEVKG